MILNDGTDFRLPANTKAAWIKRLRSGLNQTNSRLCRVAEDGTKSYCCLGVLAEQQRLFVGTQTEPWGDDERVKMIAMQPQDEDAEMFSGGENGKHAGYLSTATLPEQVQRLLAEKNDNGESFHKIADWIEANL